MLPPALTTGAFIDTCIADLKRAEVLLGQGDMDHFPYYALGSERVIGPHLSL
jgi:hypothetical protein